MMHLRNFACPEFSFNIGECMTVLSASMHDDFDNNYCMINEMCKEQHLMILPGMINAKTRLLNGLIWIDGSVKSIR